MTERPILFIPPMVRAILAGEKTQTRRIVKPAKDRDLGCELAACEIAGEVNSGNLRNSIYQIGDKLWVRETWSEVSRAQPLTDEDAPCRVDGRIIVYAADPESEGARQFACADGVLRWAKPERWRPSIHMPRWASRITLDITGVRVERLRDISAADALAEGIPNTSGEIWRDADTLTVINDYKDLWESINGLGSWDANPWVWVIEFRRVEP